jgi:HD-GYP domain-containing protein (c-di-GMP phosphodiesterase class II)
MFNNQGGKMSKKITENYYKAKEVERDIYNISWTIGKIVRNVQKITGNYDKGVSAKISSSDSTEIIHEKEKLNNNIKLRDTLYKKINKLGYELNPEWRPRIRQIKEEK